MKREDLQRAYYLESSINSCETIISQLERDEKYVCMCYEAGDGYCANSFLPNQKEIKESILQIIQKRKIDLEAELFLLLNH
jgi:hypothetical protein